MKKGRCGVIKEYLTVLAPSRGEYIEKRSKFISGLYPCGSENAAAQILQSVRSGNFGANHNVYAYVLSDGTARFSDDGEPHGTAGKPVLEVIEGAALKNVLMVVTRYFGGVLLGTGGLVRAYTCAAQNAVAGSCVVKMCECSECTVTCAYSENDKLLSLISKHNGTVQKTDFSENVKVNFVLLNARMTDFETDVREAFSGKISVNIEKTGIFPLKL